MKVKKIPSSLKGGQKGKHTHCQRTAPLGAKYAKYCNNFNCQCKRKIKFFCAFGFQFKRKI